MSFHPMGKKYTLKNCFVFSHQFKICKKIYYYSCLEVKTQNVNPQKKTAHMVLEWFLYYLFGIVFSCVS